jgi:hypothetical protein
MRLSTWGFALFGLLAVSLGVTPARADIVPLDFQCVTSNSGALCPTVASQMSLDVVGYNSAVGGFASPGAFAEPNAGQVLFVFHNAGPIDSTITQIYFYDGTLSGLASIYQPAGVSFARDFTPGHLPGLPPHPTASFDVDASNPAPQNGVNPGEKVGILFDLLDGVDYDDVLAAIGSQDLLIGMHVQSISTGSWSEGMIAVPGVVVPEPASILGLGTILLLIGARLRRKKA